ncbi:MAG: transcriptional regulator [Methanobacteriaceae archaeon]|nr:transcriptional regulator [Methanobacteriaceae archaeon]
MKPPCEIIVWYVIPSIRSKLAKELLNLGMKQNQISKILNITQAAVSQYISDKRGNDIQFNKDIEDKIKQLAIDLKEESVDSNLLIPKICEICKQIKTEEVICQIHKEKAKLPTGCNACLGHD